MKASGKAPAAKKSHDRVVKRPARGYHTFKNGRLNVTLKGDERELVKNNQASPLLRLPPEIRNRIWHFALGGKVIRALNPSYNNHCRFILRPCERSYPFSLLETCRQIYAETANLPFTTNTFSLQSLFNLKKSFKALRKHQCSLIRVLQVEYSTSETKNIWKNSLKMSFERLPLFKWLLGLQRVHVCVFIDLEWDEMPFAHCETFLKSEVAPIIQERGLAFTCEKMDPPWDEFDDE